MQELEKILEEIERAKREPWYRLSNYDVKHKLDGAINRILRLRSGSEGSRTKLPSKKSTKARKDERYDSKRSIRG